HNPLRGRLTRNLIYSTKPVLRYLANGLSNKEIAEQLLLSNKTISAHKANIYSKLGLHTIVELIDYAKMHELM
ncbi:MAG: LuxR C-terminal-related transcriptional regulator, partial [Citrobacter braakii]